MAHKPRHQPSCKMRGGLDILPAMMEALKKGPLEQEQEQVVKQPTQTKPEEIQMNTNTNTSANTTASAQAAPEVQATVSPAEAHMAAMEASAARTRQLVYGALAVGTLALGAAAYGIWDSKKDSTTTSLAL